MAEREKISVGPQPGPQTEFLRTEADIAIYGGAAGGGKSYALLLDPLRHYTNPDFGGVIFRRNNTEVRTEGGLWDESIKLYSLFQGHSREGVLEWRFPHPKKREEHGMAISFSHLEYDQTVYDYQGAQIPYIGFDELTHFTMFQFFYMLSRNRSTCGVRPYVRATCNPDALSWVREFISWWIDPETGLAIQERAGKIRYFWRQNDELFWADTAQELKDKFGDSSTNPVLPKSVTFIPSTIYDNKILMEKDPGYLANLAALPQIDRKRLKDGNWNVKATAGIFFQRGWFPVITAISSAKIKSVRFWDRAATKPTPENPDPDWTAGLLMHQLANGRFVIEHVGRLRDTPGKVEEFVKNTAVQDRHANPGVREMLEQEPGAAGVADIANYTKLLAGHDVRSIKPMNDKITRAKPVSAQAEAGNIDVVVGPWNKAFFDELENFSQDVADGKEGHDDQVDALSGAFNELCGGISILDVL